MNYLIIGNSFHLINDEIKKITNIKIDTYSLGDISLDEILDDLQYNSMFQESRCILLKNLEVLSKKESDSIKRLEDYLENSNKDTSLILVSSEKISTRSPLKNILKSVKVITTPIITKPYELAKLLGEHIRSCGFGISFEALNDFANKCATNYDIALNEFAKLKSIKGNNSLITNLDIEAYVSNYNLTDMFGFKDAVINKNIYKSNEMLEDLSIAKMEPIALVVMLAKEYEILYNIKLLSNRHLTNDEISRELDNMHVYRVKVLRESSSKYTLEELENCILKLCNMDLKMVSMDNLGYDEIRKFLLEL